MTDPPPFCFGAVQMSRRTPPAGNEAIDEVACLDTSLESYYGFEMQSQGGQ